jgi:hypothetical protein
LPEGNDALTAAYDQALSRIDAQLEGHRNLAHLVLSWVIHARRPLTVDELRYALAMAQHSTLDPSALHDPKNLTAFCTGLVVIDHENGAVRLVHYTAQSYFQTVSRTKHPNSDLLIAKTCLQYLLHLGNLDAPQFNLEAETEEYDQEDDATKILASLFNLVTETEAYDLDDFVTKGLDRMFLPFTGYALREWPYHVRDREHDLHDLILDLDGQFSVWMCALSIRMCALSIWGDDMGHYCVGVTKLMVAAFFGFEITLKKLLEQGEDVNAESRKGHTALHYAVVGNKPYIASLLLDNGATINAVATKGYTPLYYALFLFPSEPMLRLLLDRGADVNMRNQHYESALDIVVRLWEESKTTEEAVTSLQLQGCGLLTVAEEWRKENEGVDREQLLWNITNMVLGDSRADFYEQGRSLLLFAENNRVPEKVIQLIRSRIPVKDTGQRDRR